MVMLSCEDALFYKTLARCGFIKEVDELIDNIINDNELLEGLYLDLAYCFGDINKIISCLHNYIEKCKMSIDDKLVCDRLRLFIKEKLDNKEITIVDAANYLYSFVDNEKYYDNYWNDFYRIGDWIDLYEDEILDEKRFVTIVEEFIETGITFDTINLFGKPKEKYNRKRIKENRKKIEEKMKIESDEIRTRYDLSSNILTRYEYNKKMFSGKYFIIKFILLGLCELSCLAMTVGSFLYFDSIGTELSITIMLLGLSVGIYGFAILLDAKLKGIIHSTLPILCYAIPLVVIYYILQIRIGWIIGLTTTICGTILFTIYLIVSFTPYKKYEKEYLKYIRDFEESNMIDFSMCINNSYITFYKTDGTNVFIFEYKNNQSVIKLEGKFKYKNLNYMPITLGYYEINDSFENCVKKGIDLLENYENNIINIINEAINEVDPMGLLLLGCPDYEYWKEAKLIASKLCFNKVNAKTVKKIFNKQFNEKLSDNVLNELTNKINSYLDKNCIIFLNDNV